MVGVSAAVFASSTHGEKVFLEDEIAESSSPVELVKTIEIYACSLTSYQFFPALNRITNLV